MRRREFITVLGGAAVAWPIAARAQNASRRLRIGQVGTTTGQHLLAALEQRLREIGYVEGKNINLSNRFVSPNDMEEATASVAKERAR